MMETGVFVMGRLLRRRPRYTTFLTLFLAVSTILLLHHLALLIYAYHEYVLALLPSSPLPVQRRPPKSNTSDGNTAESETGGGRYRGKTDGGPRILCLIVTTPHYHQERAVHVASTWAQRCSLAVFLTTRPDPRLPRILLTPGARSYDQLWDKVTQGFQWAYGHREEFDWVVKADDDTFLVVEHLQAALSALDPDQPLASGVHLRTWETGKTYLNGGAGYVLSRGAVTRLVEEGLQARACKDNLELGLNEDVNMASCLSFVGVELLDSRDSAGRQRFHVYPPQQLIDPRQENSFFHLWLKKISIYPYKFGYSELSEEVISFHYVDAETMYLLYYLIYLVNPTTTTTINPSTFHHIRDPPVGSPHSISRTPPLR
ncbi:glycoprotein-N-acetylgalactosamine 3-beta-galactosyltransferase 1 [Procambarus clarkii]|uniref:glycoprotein-N-acetylgalactosamine 3-beta-galactosyltransferase 1 n=1 Tax=Procambarus clarkii TaxID=6728 RepID=UPI0037424214